jgi:hypothetical protein
MCKKSFSPLGLTGAECDVSGEEDDWHEIDRRRGAESGENESEDLRREKEELEREILSEAVATAQ